MKRKKWSREKIVDRILELPELEIKNINKVFTRLLEGETFTPAEMVKMGRNGCDSVPVKKAAAVRCAESNDLA
ncbi:unnamed protein product [marine sediment metagenome]|uniref:Uncharacterized protein n=1 Tax=marine sediment metagenome TaxID=412755 RepID=X0V7B7_9ZZZZ